MKHKRCPNGIGYFFGWRSPSARNIVARNIDAKKRASVLCVEVAESRNRSLCSASRFSWCFCQNNSGLGYTAYIEIKIANHGFQAHRPPASVFVRGPLKKHVAFHQSVNKLSPISTKSRSPLCLCLCAGFSFLLLFLSAHRRSQKIANHTLRSAPVCAFIYFALCFNPCIGYYSQIHDVTFSNLPLF